MERDDTRISSIWNVRSLCGIGYSVDSVWAGVPDILGGAMELEVLHPSSEG